MAAVTSSIALTPLRKKLLSMNKSVLTKQCKKYGVATFGTKKDMISRILYAQSVQQKKSNNKLQKKKKKKKKKTKKKKAKHPNNNNNSPIQIDNSVTDEVKQEQNEENEKPKEETKIEEKMEEEEKKEEKGNDEEKDDEKDPKQLLNKEYISKMNEIELYGIYSSIEGLCDRSSFKSHINDPADPKSDNFKKIMRELRKQLPKNIYVSCNGAMFVRFDENKPRFMQALLSGIDGTPYSSGLFLFDIYLPSSYPQLPCMIKHISYGANKCHANNGPGGFSPNLHQTTGKVCLSLLGTWNGPGWKPGKSNVYQVLSSLLFMVFGAKHPYYMEPGFGGWENGKVFKKKKHIRKVWEYDEEVMYHNVKYTMIQTMREPYKGFEDVIKLHFKIKGQFILKTVTKWMKHKKLSQGFKDKMKGVYNELETEIKKL